MVAPLRIDRFDRAAGRGRIHDIVVIQRTLVNQLDSDGAEDHFMARWGKVGACCSRCSDAKTWTNSLTARADQVGGDLL